MKGYHSIDQLNEFLLTHGENIVDMMGDEIDRIEMNLSVSTVTDDVLGGVVIHSGRNVFAITSSGRQVRPRRIAHRIRTHAQHISVIGLSMSDEIRFSSADYLLSGHLFQNNANIFHFFFSLSAEKIPESSSHRLGVRVDKVTEKVQTIEDETFF